MDSFREEDFEYFTTTGISNSNVIKADTLVQKSSDEKIKDLEERIESLNKTVTELTQDIAGLAVQYEELVKLFNSMISGGENTQGYERVDIYDKK